MRTRRWTEIDTLYAIGTVLVVFGHSHSSDWTTFSGTILNPIIEFIYVFHMPLFFFIAGFLLMNSNALNRIGYKKWIFDKAMRLLTPYVVLSVVALVPKYYAENGFFSGFSLAYLLKVILIPRIGVWGHFWFLPVLLILYSIIGAIKLKMTECNQKKVLIVLLLISIGLYFMPFDTMWFGFSDLKKSMVFLVIGMFCNYKLNGRERFIGTGVRVIWVFIGIIFSVFATRYYFSLKISQLLSAIIMISVCWQIAVLIGENRLCSWISKHNFTMYIYSWPFQSIAMVLTSKLGMQWYLTTLVMFITGIIVPSFMIFAYDRFKIINNRFFDLLLGIK